MKKCFKVFELIKNYLLFRKTNLRNSQVYQSLINMYCETNGYSNYFLSLIISFLDRKTKKQYDVLLKQENNILNWEDNINDVVSQIRNSGYCVLKTKLSNEIVSELISIASTINCTPSGDNVNYLNESTYPRNNTQAPTYRFKQSDLIKQPIIQKLFCEPNFLLIASSYFHAPPILDLVAMWWSTAFSKKADSGSAQMYHFDMDRIYWLKVFIYLTDVTTNSGAHCYISKSHRPGQKPKEVRKKGYSRITDEDLKKYYSQDCFKEICGGAGTIIIGDTMAYHKGKPLINSDRLLLEFEYTNSLFGAEVNFDNIKNLTQETQKKYYKYPKCFQLFKI